MGDVVPLDIKRPDGQFVPMNGIHPFYLDMDLKSFLLEITHWRIAEVEDGENTFNVTYEKNGVEIKISFWHTKDIPLGFADFISIGSDHCILSNGKPLADMSIAELEIATGVKYDFDEKYEYDHDLTVCLFGDEDSNYSITEENDFITHVHLLRQPRPELLID